MKNTGWFRSIVAASLVGIALSTFAENEADQAQNYPSIAEQFESGITNAFASRMSDGRDIRDLRTLAQRLVSTGGADMEEREQIARAMASFLGSVRAERIPNFQPLPVFANVMPPDGGGGPAIAGMDPGVIPDPVARAKYEKSLRENQENNLLNARQRELEITDRVLSERIVRYLGAAFAGLDYKSAVVAECIEKARLTDKEKEEIGRLLKPN